MAITYEPIANYTASASSTVSFTSIPSTYTDLILVALGNSNTTGSSTNNWRLQFNGDTTATYSDTMIASAGSTATSSRDSSSAVMYLGACPQTSASQQHTIFQIMNYSNATTNKTVIARGNSGDYLNAGAGLWRSTAAINRIDIFMTGQTISGTFSLYGIKAA